MRHEFSSIRTYLFVLFLAAITALTSIPAEAFRTSFGRGPSPARGSESLTSQEPEGFSSSHDTYIDENRPNNRYGGKSTVRLKERNSRNRAGLFKFDISDIPRGSRITNAKLSLYIASKSRSAKDVSVFAALDNWDESTSWSKRPDIASFEEVNVVISRTRQYYEWDLTQLVQDWIDGVETNNGVYVIANSGDVTINSKENRRNKPKLKVDFDEPQTTPPPSEEPELNDNPPLTDGTIDSGVSDAPLESRDKRVLIVANDGSGDYRTIQSALDNSRPGDTIQVKDGVYDERVNFTVSGTREEPIALVNYPNHRPVIDPGGGSYPEECCPPGGTPRVELNAEWIILEGFEIRYGWDGIKLYKGHNTILNNWIHNNKYMGILIISTSDVLIEGNTVEFNGTDQGGCWDSSSGQESPKHCHAVYMSDFLCTGISDITVRGNTLSDHGGRGIQWNGSGCNSEMQNTLVENNIIENNSWGMVLWHNVKRSVIRNNTFVLEQYPETNDSSHTFIGIKNSADNIFKNNIFYSTKGDVTALETFDPVSSQNTFDYNLWKVKSDSWKWEDGWRSDFSSRYKSVTGWDQNGLFNTDPGFYNTSNGNYHLNSDSSARDRGEHNSCAAIDFDSQDRLLDSGCDIGMDEYYD